MGSVNIATIATSIAGYSVSGVTLKDIDGIPESVTARQCPIMFPDPDNFVSGFSLSYETMASDTTAAKDVRYTLNYIFLYCPAGSTRALKDAIDTMVDKVVLILNAFANNSAPSGAIDAVAVPGDLGVLQSPSGDDFFGCRISVNIYTFYEVN